MGSAEHRAQVILYTLMMEERYGAEVPGGLLHYLREGHMQGVPAFPQEKRGEEVGGREGRGGEGRKGGRERLRFNGSVGEEVGGMQGGREGERSKGRDG